MTIIIYGDEGFISCDYEFYINSVREVVEHIEETYNKDLLFRERINLFLYNNNYNGNTTVKLMEDMRQKEFIKHLDNVYTVRGDSLGFPRSLETTCNRIYGEAIADVDYACFIYICKKGTSIENYKDMPPFYKYFYQRNLDLYIKQY